MRARLEAGCWWLPLLAFCACSGQVDLGDRTPYTGPDPGNEPPPDDPHWVKSERVIASNQVLFAAVVPFGDFLYVIGYKPQSSLGTSFFRCRKANCEGTWQELPAVQKQVFVLQVLGQRLAVAGSDSPALESNQVGVLATYALPDVTDRQVVFDGLPRYTIARFYRDFAYWPAYDDKAYYRCSLPSCDGGPRKIADTSTSLLPVFDGDSIFVAERRHILRIGALGEGPAERLLPDATLSVAPPEADTDMDDGFVAGWDELPLATSNGLLYAAFSRRGCGPSCSTPLVRWPVAGGPREEVFTTDQQVKGFFAIDDELIWVEDELRGSTLASCRVEACSSSLRHLGAGFAFAVVSDDERLYWIEETPDANDPTLSTIRSVNRLPAPDGG